MREVVGCGMARSGRPRGRRWRCHPWSALSLGLVATVVGCDRSRPATLPASDPAAFIFPDTVTLGGYLASGPSALGSIRAAALQVGEDRILVADGHTQEVHVFAVTGEHVLRVGGPGSGPGEHRAVGAIRGTPDGGFCTWDAQLARVSRFTADGTVSSVGTIDMSGLEQLRPSVRGFLEDCAIVVSDQHSVMDMEAEPEGMRRNTVRFFLYGADGLRVRPLASVLDAERWLRNRNGSHGLVQPVFGEELFAFVQGRQPWTGTSDDLRWLRRDLVGTELGEVVLGHQPRTAAAADIEAERERVTGAVAELRVTLPAEQSGFLERGAELRRRGLQRSRRGRTFRPMTGSCPAPGRGSGCAGSPALLKPRRSGSSSGRPERRGAP